MTERLKALYKTVILKHNNEPVHFEKNESAAYAVKANSLVCGDRFTLYFDVIDEKVVNLSFYGYGCAVSKASASILCEKLNGQEVEKALQIIALFFDHLKEDAPQKKEEAFEAFAAVRYFPGRRQCAALGWEVFSDKIQNL